MLWNVWTSSCISLDLRGWIRWQVSALTRYCPCFSSLSLSLSPQTGKAGDEPAAAPQLRRWSCNGTFPAIPQQRWRLRPSWCEGKYFFGRWPRQRRDTKAEPTHTRTQHFLFCVSCRCIYNLKWDCGLICFPNVESCALLDCSPWTRVSQRCHWSKHFVSASVLTSHWTRGFDRKPEVDALCDCKKYSSRSEYQSERRWRGRKSERKTRKAGSKPDLHSGWTHSAGWRCVCSHSWINFGHLVSFCPLLTLTCAWFIVFALDGRSARFRCVLTLPFGWIWEKWVRGDDLPQLWAREPTRFPWKPWSAPTRRGSSGAGRRRSWSCPWTERTRRTVWIWTRVSAQSRTTSLKCPNLCFSPTPNPPVPSQNMAPLLWPGPDRRGSVRGFLTQTTVKQLVDVWSFSLRWWARVLPRDRWVLDPENTRHNPSAVCCVWLQACRSLEVSNDPIWSRKKKMKKIQWIQTYTQTSLRIERCF